MKTVRLSGPQVTVYGRHRERDEALVGVDRRREHRGHRPAVLELAGDEVAADVREPVRRVDVLERVVAVVPEREVEVVAGGALAVERLAHERRDEAVLRGDLLDGELQEMRVVGRLERVGVLEVDLPLGAEVLLVRAHVREAERGDGVLHLPDDALRVDGRRVRVDEPRRRRVLLVARGPGPEQEELELVAAGGGEAALLRARRSPASGSRAGRRPATRRRTRRWPCRRPCPTPRARPGAS